jgi:predicted anti-sigma-YlaC factor YlaD
MTHPPDDPCAHCQEMMQPYLDHILTEVERLEAEEHLDECDLCRRRYRFEASLRMYVRQVVTEPMSATLRQKLSELRIPLN